MGIFRSKTSATIAGAAATSTGGLLTVIALLRSCWPDLPGDATSDAAAAVVLTSLLTPALSRFVAWVRGNLK